MKRSTRVFGALAVLVASLLAYPTSATAAPGDEQRIFRHYDPSSGAMDSVRSTECAKAVSARAGAWFCPQSTVRPQAGTCSSFGCWNYFANWWVEFTGDGAYGYGGTTLGFTEFFIKLTLNGTESISSPFRFESSRGIRELDVYGERLYFSTAHPEGEPVSPSTFKGWEGGPYQAGTLVACFDSTGYRARETTAAHGGVAHQYAWKDPSSAYPGTWWVYMNSPKFHKNSSGGYFFDNPPQMGDAWSGSGWTR